MSHLIGSFVQALESGSQLALVSVLAVLVVAGLCFANVALRCTTDRSKRSESESPITDAAKASVRL